MLIDRQNGSPVDCAAEVMRGVIDAETIPIDATHAAAVVAAAAKRLHMVGVNSLAPDDLTAIAQNVLGELSKADEDSQQNSLIV